MDAPPQSAPGTLRAFQEARSYGKAGCSWVLTQRHHVGRQLLFEKFRECCNAGRQGLIGRIIKGQPEFRRRPAGQHMDEAATVDMLCDVEARQQGDTCAIRGHVGQDFAAIGAEGTTRRDRNARSTVRQNPVLPPTLPTIGKAIVRRQFGRMPHLFEPASRGRHQDARHRPDLAPDGEFVRWGGRDTDRQIVVIVHNVDEAIRQRDFKTHFWIEFPETRQDRRQHRLAEPCRRADPQASFVGLVGVANIAPGILQSLDRGLDLCGEDGAVRRERYLTGGADE
ncbi:Hypothetical protein AT6N2_L0711 [Agrobacterium tumefaciens]|nr:Hypothetical protein AT6N2_L0711 [Agrobacterium tumefaciens]